jgi:acetoin utilization deacetylase AcuC-like enzyme
MAPRPVFLEHPSSLEHDTRGHPESVERLLAVNEELEAHSHFGYERIESPAVDRAVLERVHATEYVDALAQLSQAGGGQLDADTLMSSGSFVAALHSAGGAVELVRRLVEGGSGQVGFSAHRPPGHHAIPERAMGFCLFNNIAVAARYALDSLRLKRVLILDWDVHHGNGTSDIFWESDEVLLISIHEWPLYPGSGRASEVGRGAGRGYTVNLPVPPGTGDDVYVSLVRDVVLPLAHAYAPELILVSAGYDAHFEDPLADCAVTEAGFAAMTTLMRQLAIELAVPLGCVLEGGYAVHALARSVAVTMRSLLPGVSSDPSVPVDPLASEALLRLAEFWPGLSHPSPLG